MSSEIDPTTFIDITTTSKLNENVNNASQPSSSLPQPPQEEEEQKPEENQQQPPPLQEEQIEFFLVFNKDRFNIKFASNKKISDLKEHLQTLTNIPPSNQKIMYKGLAKDDQTLKELSIKNGDKLMLIGSKPQDIEQVISKPSVQQQKKTAELNVNKKEPLCNETLHKKVLDKYGKPDDCMPGILNVREVLPSYPLSGMLNKQGHKVRLTFKLENDELWIGTKERTDKIPMSSIKSVISEPIIGHEEYHLMAIQIGPTEASRYWIYWVPAQYVDAIRETLFF